jgi:DDE superfamily endonuclease
LAGALMPEPPPLNTFVLPDLREHLPADVPELLALLPQADLYLQDEVQFALHPTLTRLWSRKGRHGQRRIESPGENAHVYGFGLLDWRDGWFDGRMAPGRTAEPFCEQVKAAVGRSQARGRVAMVIVDNLRTHTPAGSLHVRQMVSEYAGQLYLVYTPKYDPDAQPIEQLWRVSRRVVTHNHQRRDLASLVGDAQEHFQALQENPAAVLRHVGSPGCPAHQPERPLQLAA